MVTAHALKYCQWFVYTALKSERVKARSLNLGIIV